MGQPRRYPIGFWNGEDYLDQPLEERVEEWADLGFTLAMSPPIPDQPGPRQEAFRLLDLAHERGIEMILCDTRTAAPPTDWGDPARPIALPPDYRQRAEAAVREFAGHPAVWGLMVLDEPTAGNHDATAAACRIVRGLTGEVEPFINLLPDTVMWPLRPVYQNPHMLGFGEFGAYLDHVVASTQARMLCFDCYCQFSEEWGGPAQYYRNLAAYQAAAIRHRIPFWFIMLSAGHWMYRAPTPLQMGWQFHTTLAYGAQGILYFLYRTGAPFAYGAPVDELGQRGPLYQQLKRQHRHFQTHWEHRFRTLSPVRATHWPTAPAGLRVFDGTGVVKRIAENPNVAFRGGGQPAVVVGEFVDPQGRPHVFVANDSAEKHAFLACEMEGQVLYRVQGDGDQRAASGREGRVTIEEHLLPGHALFYRLEP